MIKHFIHIALCLSPLLCFGQEKSINDEWIIIAQAIGDLDNDSIAEKVIICEIQDSTQDESTREIRILKIDNEQWIEWRKSATAIRKKHEGGRQRGDPFERMSIIDNVLIISFSGGSNWRWTYTDKYKFQQDQFELIHHTSTFFKPCDAWESLDFNLTTGKAIAKNGYETCENQTYKVYVQETETFYKEGLQISLENRDHQFWTRSSFVKKDTE